MRKQLLSLSLLAGTLMAGPAWSQTGVKKKEANSENGTPTFVEFNKNQKRGGNARQDIKEAVGATPDDDYRLESQETDQLGFTHYKYRQYYKGIKVEHGSYIAHERNGYLESLSGDYKKGNGQEPKASLKESDALQAAMKASGGTEFMWDTEDASMYYTKVRGKYQPEGELVWVENLASDATAARTVLQLAYKFDVYQTAPTHRRDYYYINATTGEVLFVQPRTYHVNAPASFATRYSGTQAATTDSFNGSYRLYNRTSTNSIVQTLNMKKTTRYTRAVEFLDANNQWTEYANTNKDNAALDAHLGANNTFNYFRNVLGRNSYDNAGATLKSYVHYSSSYVNAFWNGSVMTYGDGDGVSFDPLTSQDVCSHELGHAVCEKTAGLVYQKESGALNEALSDIWGACVENYYFPGKASWLIGEDFDKNAANGLGFRSMQNPNQFTDPDTYGGTYWINPNCTPASSNDYCGVHTNSGVLNYCFYLMVSGGSGTNDVGKAFNVTGIGWQDAAKIIYRMETVYMTSTTNYAGARTGAIQAATDLFGAGSQQVITTTNAFYAVNVGAAYAAPAARMAAPSELANASITENSFVASWKPVAQAASYEVETWDGTHWNLVAETGNTSFPVMNVTEQLSTWRVVAKNAKGERAESKSFNTLMARNSADEGIQAMNFFPNPSRETLQVGYKSPQTAQVEVRIVDISGRVYLQKVNAANAGDNTFEFNIRSIPTGKYILNVTKNSLEEGNKTYSKALVID